jgi:hypothetical protein
MPLQPPDGSVIERIDDFEGDLLAWPVPSFGPGRYFWAVVFGVFTCVWAAGIVAGIRSGGHVLTVVGWVIGWVVIGGWVPLGLWLSLSPTRPESVLMTAYEFRHDPGWSPPLYLLGQQIGRQSIFPKGPVTLPKSEAVFTLAGGCLSFEHEGNPVFIGVCLPLPDRQWLFGVLESWQRR